MKLLSNERGTSFLELMVVTSVIGILGVVVGNFFTDRLEDYHRDFTLTILQSNTKQAVETMEKDLKSAQVVETENRHPDPNYSPTGCLNPSYCWKSTSTTPSTIVLGVPSRNASNNLLYADSLQNVLHTDNVIYYIDSATNILYRRTIANPLAAGNAAKTTCPPALASSTCPADSKVVEDVASLVAVYYDSAGSQTGSPGNAGSVRITLQQSRTKYNRTYKSILTSQATLRNK